MTDLIEFFESVSTHVDTEIDWLIPAAGAGPQSLREAMRWSLFAGGKRFRPALVFAAGRAFGARDEILVRTAAAIEMVHTYSLIHDDLPSMDDDDLRRGLATCHKRFGEATAILAGDALQALAFQAIGADERLSDATKITLVSGLASAAARMVAGQQMDLESEGKQLSLRDVEEIHKNKTGALISFSAIAGAVIAGCSSASVQSVANFADKIGLLFQITDDLLDVTKTTEQLGKTAGKDVTAGKATYPGVLGIDGAKQLAKSIHNDAVSILDSVEGHTAMLGKISAYLLGRES